MPCSNIRCMVVFLRNSLGFATVSISDNISSIQQCSSSSYLPCLYPLPKRNTQTQNVANSGASGMRVRGVRFYLQRRARDSVLVVAGKCLCQCFYRFVYYSSNFEDAASRLKALTQDEQGLVAGGYTEGADPNAFFNQIDEMLEGMDQDKERALQMLKAAKSQLESNPNFLWRLSKATYFMSQIEGLHGNTDKQKHLVYAALEVARKGLEINDSISYTHKWVAVTLGSVGDYESSQVRIQNGYKFKEHIEKAIRLKPDDPSNHYLLGRWCFGVYMLSWVERKLAATLFADPPSATVEQALEEFLEADRLDPGSWKENMLYVAKCYIEKKDYYTSMDWLVKANRLSTVSADEKEAQKEIDSLMYKYGGYKRS